MRKGNEIKVVVLLPGKLNVNCGHKWKNVLPLT